MSDVADIYNAWSPLITAALGGGLAIIASALLFMIATALGPDLPILHCVSPKARFYLHLTAFAWFVRGVMVLTSLGASDRRAHWDMPVSWSFTVGLCLYALLYIWSQRMPPEVRERFDRRERFRRERVQGLVAEGRVADAKLAATSESGLAAMHEIGLTPEVRRTLDAAPDPLAG